MTSLQVFRAILKLFILLQKFYINRLKVANFSKKFARGLHCTEKKSVGFIYLKNDHNNQ